jgi:tetratricopeptide (TPR) repeat protein
MASTAGRPTFAPAWARLAEVHAAARRGDDAARAAENAIKLDNKQADYFAVLAEARILQKKYDDGLTQADAALKLTPNNGRASLAKGDALAARGDVDLAIAAYQAAFGALRTDPTPLVRAAQACLGGGRLTSAKSFSDRATREFPRWAPAWEVAGDVAAKDGEKAAARAAWEKALSSEGPVDAAAVRAKIAAVR